MNSKLKEKEHLLFLQRIWVQFLTHTWWFMTISNSSSRGSDALLAFMGRHIYKQNTHTYKPTLDGG